GHTQAAASGIGDDTSVERVIVGARAPWVVVPDEHAGNTDSARPVDQPLAGHAGAAANEPRAAKPTSGVVRARRTRESAAAAAASHRGDGEPQIQQSRDPWFPRTKPTRNTVWP